MNEEEELGGSFWKYSILLLILFASCSRETGPELNAQEIINTCGDAFPAAAFHLADRESLFSNPNILLGQPINYFSEVLTDGELVSIQERFLSSFKEMSGENQQQTSEQFLRWCESYKQIDELNQDFSSEEVFLHLSQIPSLSPIFHEILPERSKAISRNFTLEDFATLSSAEFHFMHQQFLTEISSLSEREYEVVKQDIERAISTTNES